VVFVSSLLKTPSFTTPGPFWFIVPELNIYVYFEKSLYACLYLEMHKKKKVVNDVATRASRRASESARSPQRVSLNAVFGGMYKHTATRCNTLQHTAAN